MYAYAWKSGIKTTYYLRSRPATRIARAAGGTSTGSGPGTSPASAAAVPDQRDAPSAGDAAACSLENPESCEACQ